MAQKSLAIFCPLFIALQLLLLNGTCWAENNNVEANGEQFNAEQQQPTNNNNKLLFVHALWRHGDRAPLYKPYPEDRNDENSWPRGWGQLTKEGMKQANELGKFLRARYVGKFLSPQFKRNELFVRSSGEDRAIESAQSVMAGMFPPTAMERFLSTLAWQPIAIHTNTVPDPLLIPFMYPCPRYIELRQQVQTVLDAKLHAKYPGLIDFVRPHVPFLKPGEAVTMLHVRRLFHIMPEIRHGMPQPDWVLRKWPEHGHRSTIELIEDVYEQKLATDITGNDEIRKLLGGYLLADWFTRIEAMAAGRPLWDDRKRKGPTKMMAYSAHDMTQMALLGALKITDAKRVLAEPPPYASCVLMELYGPEVVVEQQQRRDNPENNNDDNHKSVNLEDFQVKLFLYRNGQLDELIPLGCHPNNCTLQTLKTQIEERAIYGGVPELHKLCKYEEEDKEQKQQHKEAVGYAQQQIAQILHTIRKHMDRMHRQYVQPAVQKLASIVGGIKTTKNRGQEEVKKAAANSDGTKETATATGNEIMEKQMTTAETTAADDDDGGDTGNGTNAHLRQKKAAQGAELR